MICDSYGANDVSLNNRTRLPFVFAFVSRVLVSVPDFTGGGSPLSLSLSLSLSSLGYRLTYFAACSAILSYLGILPFRGGYEGIDWIETETSTTPSFAHSLGVGLECVSTSNRRRLKSVYICTSFPVYISLQGGTIERVDLVSRGIACLASYEVLDGFEKLVEIFRWREERFRGVSKIGIAVLKRAADDKYIWIMPVVHEYLLVHCNYYSYSSEDEILFENRLISSLQTKDWFETKKRDFVRICVY